jgi:Sortase domain
VAGLAGLALMLSPWSPAGAGGTDGSAAPSTPGSSPSTTGDAPPATLARRAGSVSPERPTRAVLPNGTAVAIKAVDSRPDGTLDVPRDIRVAGWWRGSSSLGDPFGSTLVAAHVDSFAQGLGPFASLLSVRPGQKVVLTSPHLRQSFAVTSLRLVPRGSLAHRHWIYAARGQRRLTLVTCAGPYVADRGGYQNLAVITASPTGAAVRAGA